VALRASAADIAMTAYLLLYATLLADPSATALVIAPDAPTLQAARAHLAQINQELPRPLNLLTTLVEPNRRPDPHARIVVATPEAVHGRLLRHHDRAWRLFWPRLQLVALPEIQRYTGVAAAQLADLLTRVQRVAAALRGQLPNLLATLEDAAEAETTLAGMVGQPWRIVPSDDGPRAPATLAIWHGSDDPRNKDPGARGSGGAHLRDAAEIATAIQRNGYHAHIFCQPFEQALLAPVVSDLPRLTFGPDLGPGRALVVAGYPGSHALLRRMLHAGYETVVLILGDLPHEQALAGRAAALLADPAPAWVAPTPNAYVLAKNVLCAASELPLTEAEADAWGVGDIVARLLAQGQLVDLPDPEVAWKPTDTAGDPYENWELRSPVGETAAARTEQGQVVGQVAPALYERWAFPNAALPPGRGGFRVRSRDDDTGALVLRIDGGRRTYPLRRCTVTVRDVRESRALPGSRPLGWGRVVVDEEIYGYREMSGSGAPADVALKPPLTTRWTAPACWFDLPTAIQVNGQLVGWSLAAALPLRALADFTDVVPCYDHEARRLYLVDAQPGGNGLAVWAYSRAEELLPLAYDIAHACRNDPLLEPLARVDMDWLLALLGPQPATPRAQERSAVAELAEEPRRARPAAQPSPTEYIPALPGPRPLIEPAPLADEGRATRVAPGRRRTPKDQHARNGQATPLAGPSTSPAGAPGQAGSGHDQPALPLQPPAHQQPLYGGASVPATHPPAPAAPTPRGQASAERRHEPPPDDGPPDPAALIARLRRQRERREALEGRGHGSAGGSPQPAPITGEDVEQRFAAGDTIFCLPYGDGVVRASRVEAGRELLAVDFPDYGELEIDPAVSLVRKITSTAQEDDDLL
jgi:hypothetical protein